MEQSSKFKRPDKLAFFEKLKNAHQESLFTKKLSETIEIFYRSYERIALTNGYSHKDFTWIFIDYVDLIIRYLNCPFEFQPYHKQIRLPYDYFQFGVDFLTPLVQRQGSKIYGEKNLAKIQRYIHQGDNVILLANHQTEADPIAITIMLLDKAPKLAKEMISVAGERVLTDPLSVPFSMGCNLLCIYSKRYIDHPPEQKAQKQHHNKKTMQLMSELLSIGGQLIYIAPSGGRDRKNSDGKIIPAPFDPQSIEMLYLMSNRAKKQTHFFTLALSTYTLLPPPETIQQELGENRVTEGGTIQLAFGKELDMERLPIQQNKDKHLRRKLRADYIHNLVLQDYQAMK